MSVWVLPISRLLHFAGFSLLLGGALAALLLLRARPDPVPEDGALEGARRTTARVVLPGVYVVLLGGLLALLANPAALDARGPQGPWLHLKLPLVFGAVVLAHLAWLRLETVSARRARGEPLAESGADLRRAERLLAGAGLATLAAIVVASLRFLFG